MNSSQSEIIGTDAFELGDQSFYGQLAEIIDRNTKPGFDGEEIRAKLQEELEGLHALVAEHSDGAELSGEEAVRVREASTAVEDARTYEISGVNMAHAWPAKIEQLMSEQRVMDVEARNPSQQDLVSINAIAELYPAKCRLVIVIDQNYPGYAKEKQAEIEASVLADLRGINKHAQEGREVSVVFTENMKNIVLAQVNEFIINQPETLYVDDEGAVWYRPLALDNPLAAIDIEADNATVNPGILLIDASGEPTAEAGEAASFINAVNADTVHLLFSQTKSQHQRDKIWELVRGMSMRPVDYSMFHEVFYEEDGVGHAASVMTRSIGEIRQQDKPADNGAENSKEFFDFGFDWDVVEYVTRNYGETILPEDKAIMDFVMDGYRKQRDAGEFELGSLESAADLGAGPNLYTLMMITPYLSDGASIHMADYTPANRRFLQWFADGEPADTPEGREFASLKGVYKKFEAYMAEHDPVYEGSYERLRTLLNHEDSGVEFINLYAPVDRERELDMVASSQDRQKLDAVTSAFVTESMANSYSEFILLTYNILNQVKPGGRFVLMHMAESEGYNAGNDNNFPASKVDLEMVRAVYEQIVGPNNFTISLAEDAEEKAREGYEGMIVVTGTVPDDLPSVATVLGLKEKLAKL